MDAELHREENDLYLGHPWIGAGGGDSESVCECGHVALMHVEMASPLGVGRCTPIHGACSHGGCTCTAWKETHDLEDA